MPHTTHSATKGEETRVHKTFKQTRRTIRAQDKQEIHKNGQIGHKIKTNEYRTHKKHIKSITITQGDKKSTALERSMAKTPLGV